MIYKIRRQQQLNCDMETAWEFFSSPTNLSKITPKAMGFTVLSKDLDRHITEGMTIEYMVSPFLGIPLHWKTIITNVDVGKSFTDEQERGPYKYWKHSHRFIKNEHGILMIDSVDYQLPFGLIGVWAHDIIVKKKLTEIFDYRHEVVEELFNDEDHASHQQY